MAANFILGRLAGSMLAPNLCFARLPITMLFVGAIMTATLLSTLMQQFAR